MPFQDFTFQHCHFLSVPPINPTQLAGESFDVQVSCLWHVGITWLPRGHGTELRPEACHSLGLLPKKAPLENALAIYHCSTSTAMRLHVPGVL